MFDYKEFKKWRKERYYGLLAKDVSKGDIVYVEDTEFGEWVLRECIVQYVKDGRIYYKEDTTASIWYKNADGTNDTDICFKKKVDF